MMRIRISSIKNDALIKVSGLPTYVIMSDWKDWISMGERARCTAPDGRAHYLFYREFGSSNGPAIVFIHGFPTHSMDWANIVPAFLDRRVIVVDLLGFGASDKPRIAYTYQFQTDLILALFNKLALTRATIVSHDYAVSIVQELLAREAEGRTSVTIEKCIFLNGGVFPELHRQQRIHKLLRTPLLGRLVASLVSANSLQHGLTRVAGKDHPWSTDDAKSHFEGMRHASGKSVVPRLLHYIDERAESAGRWVNALRQAEAKIGFVWGPEDPVSGAHIAQRIRSEFSAAHLIELEGAGHYPHWEVPERTAQAIRSLLEW